ncbi:hypothetical protein G5S37_02625 [Roseimicrobium sp. ORNL1]|nr:hypothetical protein G5S37_02625 [Roseimicrobium sp. ORNL1]
MSTLSMILGFWTSALCVWLYAATLGKPVQQMMVNPKTGQPWVYKYHPHTFFFIPANVWTILSVLLAIAMSVLLPFVKLPEGKALAGPGNAEFDSANSLITSNRNGAAHGNTPVAKELAEKFSLVIREYRNAGVEKAKKKSSLSLTDGQFLTYCHLREDDCVFLVHVPDLRKFNGEAKKFICTAAWHTANLVLAGQPKLPTRLAVGVRGAMFYEEIVIGSAVGDSEDPAKGIQRRYDGMNKQVVFPFFAPPKPAKDTGTMAKGTKPTSAASEKAAASAKAQPEASPSASNSVTPAPASPEVAPPTASTSPPAMPASSAASPTTAALPTEVREWRSADGRPMKASLVRFNDSTGATARFRREDGQEFDVPVEKFSPEDQSELKRLHQLSQSS